MKTTTKTIYQGARLQFKTLDGIDRIELCQPGEYNRLNSYFWLEFPEAFTKIEDDAGGRVIVISSTGKHFTTGLDISHNEDSVITEKQPDTARETLAFREKSSRLRRLFLFRSRGHKAISLIL